MFVKETTNPTELREIANGLGIVWVGKSNEDLAAEINEAMETKMNGATATNLTDEELFGVQPGETKAAFEEKIEVTEEAISEETVEEIIEEAETPQEAEEVIESVVEKVVEKEIKEPQLTVVPKEEKTETPAPAATTQKRVVGKWFDQEGAFPYEAGQKIEIVKMNNTKHNFLVGRFAVINGPSTKKDAVKAQLVHPTTGKLQKTNCTFTYDEIQVVEEKVEQEVI